MHFNLPYNDLGPVPGIEVLRDQITSTFDLLDPDTLTTEKVFANTHRLVADSDLAEETQRHSTASRKIQLAEFCEPQIKWLQAIYPAHEPILIQCATLPINAELMWHMDTYLYHSVSHKIHIPIVTNKVARYEYVGGSVNFQFGQAYEINNILLHRATNHGSAPRTHVIIDMIDSAKLRQFQRLNINPIFTYHAKNKARETKELHAQ